MCLKVELCCHLCGTCTSKKSRPEPCCQSLMHWTIAMTPLWFLYKFGKKFGWTPSTSMSGWCCAHNTHVVSGRPQHCNFGICKLTKYITYYGFALGDLCTGPVGPSCNHHDFLWRANLYPHLHGSDLGLHSDICKIRFPTSVLTGTLKALEAAILNVEQLCVRNEVWMQRGQVTV